LKKSAAEAHRLLVEAYADAALNERSCREWFQKFKNGEFDVEDKERKAESVRRRGIGSMIGRFVPNAKRTCTYIRIDSTNNFISFEIIGNDSNDSMKSKGIGFHMN